MRRLVWAFAGRTYNIVGNLMSWLIYSKVSIIEKLQLVEHHTELFEFSYNFDCKDVQDTKDSWVSKAQTEI